MTQLRFAPLVRVSTERSEKKGESLNVQTGQLTQAIKSLGGTVYHWYKGQEHATPEQERKILEMLIQDAQAHKFDAIMVTDLSRWSRDNQRSKSDLKILKSNGIRFFVLTQEFDLFDPLQGFMVGMNVEVAEFFARQQTYKSQLSRIARAARSVPSAGKLPYGRTFDRATETWGIDGAKLKKIEWAAKEYLKGEQIPKLAKTLGMNQANLWKILTKRSGDTWEIEFSSKQLAINEKVTLKVPPLLSPEIIKRIHKRAEANKTYSHGVLKYEYLLARTVFCSQCGLSLFGQTNHNGRRYYRHSRNLEHRECDKGLWIRADGLEEAVLLRLFSTVGDAEGIQRAMLKAIPDRKEIQALRERKKFLESELSKVGIKKDRLIESITEGVVSKEESKAKMTDIRERETSIKAEIETIEPQLADIPTEQEIRGRAKMIERIVSQIYRTPSRLKKMSFDERRKLIVTFFSGKDTQGRRLGVYVTKGKGGDIQYEIRGVLGVLEDRDINVEYLEELQAVFEKPGQCHAYHCFRFHQ